MKNGTVAQHQVFQSQVFHLLTLFYLADVERFVPQWYQLLLNDRWKLFGSVHLAKHETLLKFNYHFFTKIPNKGSKCHFENKKGIFSPCVSLAGFQSRSYLKDGTNYGENHSKNITNRITLTIRSLMHQQDLDLRLKKIISSSISQLLFASKNLLTCTTSFRTQQKNKIFWMCRIESRHNLLTLNCRSWSV